ncbi:hypothetical protein HQ520_14110 [bacterium]|nr:hypothetical protein [bacterium]
MKTSKRLLILLASIGLIAGLTGCRATVSKMTVMETPTLEFAGLERDQYEILDTVEGHGMTARLFFLIPIGDKEFGYLSPHPTATSPPFGARRSAMAAATYDALSKVQEADMILPLSFTTSRSGIPFIYQKWRSKVKGKAVRIKSDTDLARESADHR